MESVIIFTAYIQEIGRCGRDGKSSRATLFYNNTDIASTSIHLQEKMRDFVKNTSVCRRKYIMEYFGFPHDVTNNCHTCCDICLRACTCEQCIQPSSSLENTENCLEKFDEKKRQIAYKLLVQYFDAENNAQGQPSSHLKTGLSPSLATSISMVSEYSNVDKLAADFPMLKQNYTENISSIISKVKNMLI